MYTLPERLNRAIRELVSTSSIKALLPYISSVHDKYTSLYGSKRLEKEEALAYCFLRMPATYGALCYLFSKMDESGLSFEPTSLLDVGCGPGTAYFAMKERYPSLQEAVCIDHNEHLLTLFKTLCQKMNYSLPTFSSAVTGDRRWDVGVLSYALGEMEESVQERLVQEMVGRCSYLFLIEPGTPHGFSTLMRMRKQVLEKGYSIVAPCPHGFACPMESTKAWCHVRVRLERPEFQRSVKAASLSYEDEAFCYLIIHTGSSAPRPRIVNHPQKRSGHVHLSLCQLDGHLKKIVVSKKDSSYSRSKCAEWGELW